MQPPTTYLKTGDTGADVKQLQNFLVSIGYLTPAQMATGPGIYGPATTEAVAKYQSHLGVNNTGGVGAWGPLTIAAATKDIGTAKANANMSYGTSNPNANMSVGTSNPNLNMSTNAGSTVAKQPAVTTKTGPSVADLGISGTSTAKTTTTSTTSGNTASGQTGGGNVGSTTPTNNFIDGTNITKTGNAAGDATLASIATYIKNNEAAGNTINPNIDVNPQTTANLIAQYHATADPTAQQQLNSVIGDVNQFVANQTAQYQNAQLESTNAFGQNLFNQRETEAGQGTALSGLRQKNENIAASNENASLANLNLQYGNSIRTALNTAAGKVGQGGQGVTGNINAFNLPTTPTKSVSLEGTRGTVVGGENLDTGYNPSLYTQPGSIGKDLQAGEISAGKVGTENYLTGAVNKPQTFTNNNGVLTLT